MPEPVDIDAALGWRLRRHHLVERAPAQDALRVVHDICGLHAQLMSSAELSLWARVDGLERDAISAALWERRTLVKLWAMRGTLHLLPTEELGLWIAGLGTYTNRGMTGHPEIDALTAAIRPLLEGRFLTREELALELPGRLAQYLRESWGSYLKPASFRGLLCFGPADDNRARFTSPSTWLGESPAVVDAEGALREIARRFLAAYAPCTADDLALWWGVGPARGRRMLASLGDEAVELDVDGERLWVLARDARGIAATEPRDVATLLPAFDPWVVGASRTSAAVIDPRHRPRVYRPQGWFSPVLLVNGRIAGVWKHTRRGRRLLVQLEPFGRVARPARAELEREAERLAAYFDCRLELGYVSSPSNRTS